MRIAQEQTGFRTNDPVLLQPVAALKPDNPAPKGFVVHIAGRPRPRIVVQLGRQLPGMFNRRAGATKFKRIARVWPESGRASCREGANSRGASANWKAKPKQAVIEKTREEKESSTNK